MLSFPPAVQIWLATTATDLRKSFDTLAEVVRQHLHHDPLSGHVFVFRNKRSDRVKLLYWDEDGYAIWYKRLEEGVFAFPEGVNRRGTAVGEHGVQMRAADLAMLLDGVDLSSVQRSKRYQRSASA